MNPSMTAQRLYEENLTYQGTGGVSANNRSSGFLPAFRDSESGIVELARFKDGSPAPMHLLDGLPDTWVMRRSHSGHAIVIKNTVIAGFLYQGHFLTREQAANTLM